MNNETTEQTANTLKTLAKKIKLLILDVDGVLTNGQIVYDDTGRELKFFNVKDGLAIKQAQQLGIDVAIITARNSEVVQKRASELKIKYLYQGATKKIDAYQELLRKASLTNEQVAYLGDDWPDLPVLNQVGLPAIVNDAEPSLRPMVKYITKQPGGMGAARELIYLILRAQNKFEQILKNTLV